MTTKPSSCIHLTTLKFASLALATLSLCPFSELAGRKQADVAVDSMAQEAYQLRKDSEEGPLREEYILMKGRFFGGGVRDKSLKEVSIDELSNTLAKELVKRNYYPAKNSEENDLLIVVHWGVTNGVEELDELTGETDLGGGESDGEEYSDISPEDELQNERFKQGWGTQGVNANAGILGFDSELSKRGLTQQDEYELKSALKSERYFIILMAYDWKMIRNKEKSPLLWSTRFSIDSIGTNFHAAYPALFRAASDHFGTNLDGLSQSKTHFGTGNSSMGELEVVETYDSSDTASDSKNKSKK